MKSVEMLSAGYLELVGQSFREDFCDGISALTGFLFRVDWVWVRSA